MQAPSKPAPADSSELRHQIKLLAAAEPSDAAFLSCYLDARRGRLACLAFVAEKAAVMRDTLNGNARLEFENALTMLEHQLEGAWQPNMQGIALFARWVAGGRHLSVVRCALPFENRMVLYRVPELLPLLAMLQHEDPVTVLLARHAGLQVLNLELGIATPRAWAAHTRRRRSDRAASGSTEVCALSRQQFAPLDKPLQLIRRIVSASSTPLVVAGDSDALREVGQWLPQRAAARLLGSVRLSPRLDQREAIEQVRHSLLEVRMHEARQLAGRVVRAMRGAGLAVAGEGATFAALCAGRVDTLVIAEGRPPVDDVPWEPRIELSRLAVQQGARVVLVDSDELRSLGGVGCLLRQRGSVVTMPVPQPYRGLELVA